MISHKSLFDQGDLLHNKRSSEVEWARFCLHPDKFEPVRMPSFFPLHSHLSIARTETTLNLPVGDTGAVWSPEYFRNGFAFWNNQTGGNVYFLGGNNYALGIPDRPPLSQTASTLISGGVRLVGAILNIDYIGRTDDISGLIEVGADMVANNPNSTSNAEQDVGISPSNLFKITQSPFYYKTRSGHGIRLIWLPIDESKFEFRPGLTTDGAEEKDVNFVRDDVRMDWAIRFSGLAVPSQFRVSIKQYYEVIPDENLHDIYCLRKGKGGDVDTARKIVHGSCKIRAEDGSSMIAGSNKGSESYMNWLGQKFYEYAGTILSPQNMGAAAGGLIGSMVGPQGTILGSGIGAMTGKAITKYY